MDEDVLSAIGLGLQLQGIDGLPPLELMRQLKQVRAKETATPTEFWRTKSGLCEIVVIAKCSSPNRVNCYRLYLVHTYV
jgi:hypothetical protein